MTRTLPILKTVKLVDDTATGSLARRLRLQRQLRLKDVADYAGVSITQLSRLEKGKTPWSDPVITKVNEALAKK